MQNSRYRLSTRNARFFTILTLGNYKNYEINDYFVIEIDNRYTGCPELS